MNIKFVPFEEIDKNKWNGTVHYAHNTNVYGYYWYLKSVIKEWDALVEDDYESVMPLPRVPLSDSQKKLLPMLGPYSVNQISKLRISSFFELWKQYKQGVYYPFNPKTTIILDTLDPLLSKSSSYSLDLGFPYDVLFGDYGLEVQATLSSLVLSDFEFGSALKPEKFLSDEKIKEVHKNALYRVFYNAIQRGTGWSMSVYNMKSKQSAKAFYISDQKGIYQLYASPQNDPKCYLLLVDTLIKSNANRVISLELLNDNPQIYSQMGCEKNTMIHGYVEQFSIIQRLLKFINS
jgi:hypothetical protein